VQAAACAHRTTKVAVMTADSAIIRRGSPRKIPNEPARSDGRVGASSVRPFQLAWRPQLAMFDVVLRRQTVCGLPRYSPDIPACHHLSLLRWVGSVDVLPMQEPQRSPLGALAPRDAGLRGRPSRWDIHHRQGRHRGWPPQAPLGGVACIDF
jgi:hypothetical protein